MSLSDSKDGCISLLFNGDFVSAVSLWHNRAVKKSYKKRRFATFTRLTIATVVAHTCNYFSTIHLSTLWPAHVTLDTRPCDSLCNRKWRGPGNEANTMHYCLHNGRYCTFTGQAT